MRITYIELLGQKHPLCFSLAASEKLDEHFGSLDKMADEVYSGELKRAVKALDTALQVLMAAGRIYCQAAGIELPPALPCRPVDLMDFQEASAAMNDAIKSGSAQQVEVEDTGKNAGATQG